MLTNLYTSLTFTTKLFVVKNTFLFLYLLVTGTRSGPTLYLLPTVIAITNVDLLYIKVNR